jgi:ubiquinone/menaquinone biosynthesis C-methylase UbiE
MAFMLDNCIRRVIQNPFRILGEYIRSGHTAVDMGCGPGFFTTAMAEIVGKTGRVVAVDLQEEMLDHVRKKAAARNLNGVIKFHRCTEESVGLHLEKRADFFLAYYVVHELPDPARFFREARQLLNEKGKCLVVEPRLHVGKFQFKEMIRTAEQSGFRAVDRPKRKGGRSVLLAP